jgi:hypothetical protein
MLFRPLLHGQVASRLPIPVNFRERQALELDSFSEYAAAITPEQRLKIDGLALEIVKSNDTNNPIFEFRVEGFADVARRIADKVERMKEEETISLERALNGFDVLVEGLKKHGGDPIARKIAKGSRAFGLGTLRLKIPNATTEAQFSKNRRVVFIVREVTFLPPPPEPPPPPSSVIEDRFSVRLLQGAVVTVSHPLVKGIESATLTATLQITDHIDKKRAEFVVLSTGAGFGAGPTAIGGSITFTPGPEVRFKTFRLLRGPGAATIDVKSFEGAVTVFIDFGAGIGPFSRGGTLSFSFDGLEANGANTQPTVIRVPGGTSSLSVPGIFAGDVMLGRMIMKGTPIDL